MPVNTLVLKRIAANPDGIFGVLIHQGTPFAVTLERPWVNNQSNCYVSCIPVGSYLCRRVNSPRFGNTFEVLGVIGRSDILFHSGNTIEDTRGCILVGEQFGRLGSRTAILVSKEGFKEFMKIFAGGDGFYLEIVVA